MQGLIPIRLLTNGTSPLMAAMRWMAAARWCAEQNIQDIIDLLLTAGADPSAKSKSL